MAFLVKARKIPPVQLTARERQIVDSYRRAVAALGQQVDLKTVGDLLRGATSVDSGLPLGGFIDELAGFVDAVRSEVGASGISAVANALPTGYKAMIRFDAVDPRAIAWAEQRAGVLIAQVTNDQREMLRRTVAQGITDQITAEELGIRLRSQIGLHSQWAMAVERATIKEMKRLTKGGLSEAKALDKAEKFRQRYHDKLVRTRAKNIARTEIITAQNQGRLLGWLDMVEQGVMSPTAEKEWIVGPSGWKGKTVCDVCAPLNGEKRPITGSFSVGVNMPPAHPNCRCTAVVKPISIEKIRELLAVPDDAYAQADTVLMKAREIEPAITKQLIGIADTHGGRMDGLEFRIKERASLARKLASDAKLENITLTEAAAGIGDSVRYTMVLPMSEYSTTAEQILEMFVSQGFKVKVKSTWNKGVVYKGLHFNVTDAAGNIFELQFHTENGLKIKHQAHVLYERWRIMEPGEKRDSLFKEMVELQNQNAHPAGVSRFATIGTKVTKTTSMFGKVLN
jgi:hypothetical protein